MTLSYVSICDGIGAAHVAWNPLGWRCAWTSEIAAFPAAVVERRWGLSNLGDVLRITEGDCERFGPVDVLVGGTPCQSFSVAGQRGGLGDPRGNLALRFFQLAGLLRPRWVVWENVPGVLSSGGGRDFGSILGAMADLGYGWAYRVLDAQYFGLAQRRKRVFAVGCFGDWRRAAAVLVERAGLRGDPAPGRETRAGVANAVTASLGSGGPDDNDAQGGHLIAGTLQENYADNWGLDNQHVDAGCPMFVTHALRAEGFDASEDGTGRGTPIVPCALMENQRAEIRLSPQTDALTKGGEKPGQGYAATFSNQGVRRLTPRECERLQGFPDDYTLIDFKRKPARDGLRYAALGNSMAVPVMRWIGKRIAASEARAKARDKDRKAVPA